MKSLLRSCLGGAGLLFCLCFCACGRIEFGSDQDSPDAGMSLDMGIEDPDGGPQDPDLGIQSGCVPVPEPPAKPANWPYARNREAYETHFFNRVAGNDSVGSLGCTRSQCHADNANSPLIPLRVDLSNMAVVTRSINELWATVVAGGTKADTRLRSAHASGGEAAGDYSYLTVEQTGIYEFEQATLNCRWLATYQARPDGGGGCPDASSDSAVDGGAALCECRLPARDLSHCGAP